jgi:hypothetical protein
MDMIDMLSRRMAEAPALATLWDTDRKVLAGTLAWGNSRGRADGAAGAGDEDGACGDQRSAFASNSGFSISPKRLPNGSRTAATLMQCRHGTR